MVAIFSWADDTRMLIQRERDVCFMSEASSLENYLGAEFWRHYAKIGE